MRYFSIISLIGVLALSSCSFTIPFGSTTTTTVTTTTVKTTKVKPSPGHEKTYDYVKAQRDRILLDEYFLYGLKHFEGFYANRYTCSGGARTIGYGFTGPELKGRWKISKHQADRELVREVLPKYLAIVDEVVKVPLSKNQRLALLSFTYNNGEKGLRQLVEGKGRLNDGNYASVARLMPLYRKAGGKVRLGLVRRRSWEVNLWKGKKIQLPTA